LPAVTDFISFPFYDLVQENGHVPEIREKLPPLLAGVRRSVLEIGAGTGLITTSLADWTPAEIFALEPSAGMRAVLLSRLSSRPELLERVTVLSCDALSLELDEPVESNHTVLARRLRAYLAWRNANAAIPTSWPPSAANAPASAANDSNAGADPGPKPHDQTQRTFHGQRMS
jgi:SAM-dependent methyltransferase